MNQVTQLLSDLAGGRNAAADELFPLVYEQLRALAGSYFREERSDHTLQPTALVHEAFVRMVAPGDLRVSDRAHFYALAARVMRHVLVDYARQNASEKRGGDRARITLDEQLTPWRDRALDFEAIERALSELGQLSERTAKVVEMRFFCGLTCEEIAGVMSISLSSVEREWRFARAWLQDRLGEDRVA